MKVTKLLQSTANSWVTSNTNTQPDLTTYPDTGFPVEGNRGPQTLAVALQGSFSSFFTGKPSPFASPTPIAGTPTPKAKSIKDSVAQYESWAELKAARVGFDETMIGWANRLDQAAIEGDLTWFSGAAGREVTKPKALLIAHLFNHQTHHRGQAHAMLTAAGEQTGDTDLMLIV